MFSRPKIAVIGLSCVAMAALSPAPSGATPATGVTAETLLHASIPALSGSVQIEGTDLTLRRIEIAPGGSTGWHYHDGPVYALVESGILTRTLQDCTTVVSTPGQTIAEDVGPDHVHEGANLGSVPVVLYAVYAEPSGKPFSEDAAAPGCS